MFRASVKRSPAEPNVHLVFSRQLMETQQCMMGLMQIFGTLYFSTRALFFYGASLGVCGRRTGLRLLRMLGVGVKVPEAAGDAHAAPAGLSGEPPQLLDQLWRHGQLCGGGQVALHQLPAAVQTLSGAGESEQEAF